MSPSLSCDHSCSSSDCFCSGMTGMDFNIAVTAFFLTYCFAEGT